MVAKLEKQLFSRLRQSQRREPLDKGAVVSKARLGRVRK